MCFQRRRSMAAASRFSHLHIYVWIYVYIYIYIYTNKHTYTHIQIYIYNMIVNIIYKVKKNITYMWCLYILCVWEYAYSQALLNGLCQSIRTTIYPMYIHIYISYIYTYIYIYICILYIYIYTYRHVLYIYIHTYIHTYMHIYMYIYIYTYTFMYIHTYMYIYSRGKFRTNVSPYGRIRQVQNTTQFHNFDTINSNLN